MKRREFTEQAQFLCLSHGFCRFKCGKTAKIDQALINRDVGPKRAISFIEMNAFYARSTVSADRPIPVVLLIGRFSQIIPSIIRGILVFMIDAMLGPLTSHP